MTCVCTCSIPSIFSNLKSVQCQGPAESCPSSDPSRTRRKLLPKMQKHTVSAVVLEYPCFCFSPVCSMGKQPGQCFLGSNYTEFSEASGDLIPIDFTGCLNLFVNVVSQLKGELLFSDYQSWERHPTGTIGSAHLQIGKHHFVWLTSLFSDK